MAKLKSDQMTNSKNFKLKQQAIQTLQLEQSMRTELFFVFFFLNFFFMYASEQADEEVVQTEDLVKASEATLVQLKAQLEDLQKDLFKISVSFPPCGNSFLFCLFFTIIPTGKVQPDQAGPASRARKALCLRRGAFATPCPRQYTVRPTVLSRCSTLLFFIDPRPLMRLKLRSSGSRSRFPNSKRTARATRL